MLKSESKRELVVDSLRQLPSKSARSPSIPIAACAELFSPSPPTPEFSPPSTPTLSCSHHHSTLPPSLETKRGEEKSPLHIVL
ncbi:unnamed protein product [Linum trigynum]|uniref:Uncharacterized protein n=1 Tax=Linum trigynum TaxID=586398 RepID=A0AAV2EUC9_9ROSI